MILRPDLRDLRPSQAGQLARHFQLLCAIRLERIRACGVRVDEADLGWITGLSWVLLVVTDDRRPETFPE
jgi:hypothetical protein